MDCNECKKPIDEKEENSFECDGCWSMHHTKCAGVRRVDVSARKGSKCLKLYCTKCYADPGHVLSDNVQTMLKYIYKIDLATQKQEAQHKDLEIMLQKAHDENVLFHTKMIESNENVRQR